MLLSHEKPRWPLRHRVQHVFSGKIRELTQSPYRHIFWNLFGKLFSKYATNFKVRVKLYKMQSDAIVYVCVKFFIVPAWELQQEPFSVLILIIEGHKYMINNHDICNIYPIIKIFFNLVLLTLNKWLECSVRVLMIKLILCSSYYLFSMYQTNVVYIY